MANKEQIKKAILEVAGNPSSGVVIDLADAWAEAITRLDSSIDPEKKEIRVTKPEELR